MMVLVMVLAVEWIYQLFRNLGLASFWLLFVAKCCSLFTRKSLVINIFGLSLVAVYCSCDIQCLFSNGEILHPGWK
jgi:hypothetical protein